MTIKKYYKFAQKISGKGREFDTNGERVKKGQLSKLKEVNCLAKSRAKSNGKNADTVTGKMYGLPDL